MFNLRSLFGLVSSDIAIVDTSISRRHCLIRHEAGTFTIADLQSQNGTFVNEVPIRARALASGDQIAVGGSVFLFLLEREEDSPAPSEQDPPSETLLRQSTIHLEKDDALYLKPGRLLREGETPSRAVLNYQSVEQAITMRKYSVYFAHHV